MSSLFSQEVLEQESQWFLNQTSLFDQTNRVRYNIPREQVDSFKHQFRTNSSDLLKSTGSRSDALVTELLLRRCFKKCNKFVLEDWIDYDELDCTLKCASVSKEAYGMLNNML